MQLLAQELLIEHECAFFLYQSWKAKTTCTLLKKQLKTIFML